MCIRDSSKDLEDEVRRFVFANCKTFGAANGEYELEHTKIYNDFKTLLERKLEGFIERCGASVGDFYEAYGVDALLLVEHCGLNPMAQKARAGCPIPNVQQTLNGLTSAGFAVNVYEEHPHELMGGTKLKKRFLSQVVTPASPTYLHEACMGRVDLEYAEPPPVAGVCGTATMTKSASRRIECRPSTPVR